MWTFYRPKPPDPVQFRRIDACWCEGNRVIGFDDPYRVGRPLTEADRDNWRVPTRFPGQYYSIVDSVGGAA